MAEEKVDLGGNNTVNIGVLGDLLNLVMERIEALESAQPKPPGPTMPEGHVERLVLELNTAIDEARDEGARPLLRLSRDSRPEVSVVWIER